LFLKSLRQNGIRTLEATTQFHGPYAAIGTNELAGSMNAWLRSEDALAFVDPEIGEAKVLWKFILHAMPPVESVERLKGQHRQSMSACDVSQTPNGRPQDAAASSPRELPQAEEALLRFVRCPCRRTDAEHCQTLEARPWYPAEPYGSINHAPRSAVQIGRGVDRAPYLGATSTDLLPR
jgi:hypothetical protein